MSKRFRYNKIRQVLGEADYKYKREKKKNQKYRGVAKRRRVKGQKKAM